MRVNVTKMAKKAHEGKMHPFWEQMDRYETSVEALKWIISCDLLGKNEIISIRDQVEKQKNDIIVDMAKIEESLAAKEDETKMGEQIEVQEETYAQERRFNIWTDIGVFILYVAVALAFVCIAHIHSWEHQWVRYSFFVLAAVFVILAVAIGVGVVSEVSSLGETSHGRAVSIINARLDRLETSYNEKQESLEECYELLNMLREYLEN